MDMQLIERVTAAFAALDFTTENQQIAELEAKIAEHHRAIERADNRRIEIGKALYEGAKPDGVAVAEALLADASPGDAALAGPNKEQMEAERASLREGISELQSRVRDIRAEIEVIRAGAMTKAHDVAQPLADEIFDQVRQAVAVLPSLYTALTALGRATKTGAVMAEQLRPALEAMQGSTSLLPWSRFEQVPPEIVAALEPLATKGPAMGNARFLTTVEMP